MKRMMTLLLALALALACPAALAEGFTPALDTDTACEITVIGNYNNFEALEAEFVRFNEYYPDVELSFVKLDDYKNSFLVNLSGDDGANIYTIFPWMIGKEGYEAAFDAAEDLSDPALGLDLGCIREGLLYRDAEGRVPMVPIFATSYGILVNEAIFDENGIDVPTTYDGLVAACDKLVEAGYPSPLTGYMLASNGSMLPFMSTPYLCLMLRDKPEDLEKLNALAPEAGEIVRPALEMVERVFKECHVDMDACNQIADNYSELILKFFEGNSPMVMASGDIVSGTHKRESMSEAFTANPFPYSFRPFPFDDEGGCFLNITSFGFAVNKNCENLDMTNEFMRFLVSTQELSEMSRMKRLITPTRDMTLDEVYAAFGQMDDSRWVYEQDVPILDAPIIQSRVAAYEIVNGRMSVDDAVAGFGSFVEN